MKNVHRETNPAPALPEPSPNLAGAPPIDSATLLHGYNQVLIRHGGRTYTLRLTRGDKLILTK